VTLTATVSTTSIGLPPAGTVQFFNGSTPISGTVTYTSTNAFTSTTTPYASLAATLTTSFTANASITAQYVPGTNPQNYQGSTSSPALAITISGGTPSFSLAALPTSFTISAPGQSGITTISASAINSFTGTVSVTCSLPAAMTYSSCSLVPTSFSVPGGSSQLTVNTTAPSTVVRLFDRPRWFIPSAGALFACLLLLLMPTKKRRAKLAFGLLVFALLSAALVACGGGTSTPPPPSGGTPTGTYTVTVTGTNGNLTSSVLIPVTVQ
jgi:hypothetical protein